MSEELINRYRPSKFSEVVGHNDIVDSFQKALEDGKSRSFLFTGPTGVGKTSLARLGAKFVGSKGHNLTEVDGAKHTGVDEMRALTGTLSYKPLGKDGVKALIVDEAHRISVQAWDSILKIVEEPPPWVYWFLVTTNIQRVPETIRTRCSCYTLTTISTSIIFDYLEMVVQEEKFKTPRGIVELCAKSAGGSLRRALSNLAVCYDVPNREQAAKLIANVEAKDGGPAFELARAIATGRKWKAIHAILEDIQKDEELKRNPETVRHTVRGYFTSVILNSDEEKVVCDALRILDNFSEPYVSTDGMTPLVISIGRTLFTS